jgi:L-asparagine oxygenase
MPDDCGALINTVLAKGFAFRERLSPEVSTDQLAQALGEPVGLSANSPVHALTPKSTAEAPSNTYSGNYGLGEFPLHTDMANWHEPPRYLMLRCVVGAPDVATTVVDPRSITETIGIENLARALMKPRRRVAGRMSLLPIVQPLHDGMMVRWDERYLEPASRAGEVYAAEMRQRLRKVVVTPVVLAQPGDTVVIDNWKMLHGRAAVPESSRSRRIERVYLKALAQ